ncbi:hypothetical protein [Mycolicibacterium parafortuitum]|uniref:Uncharacterized protein n=1 Tax=Mycolicibacterium parafortuitum TaxID=39692 RepID=A0A375YCS3_MYCPF|nr:hypothetical protein BST38_25300 [Mycolicibacterium parafortuitum]SRX78905.1 hypothetical protein MPP7335_00638 [Mycolicibacterium parafortuitum]
MRVSTAAVVVTAALAVTGAAAAWVAPNAVAETAVLAEQPGDGRAVFLNDPAIVDPQPLRAESYHRVPGDRAVAVHFTTGTPQCFGVHATATETADAVTVELQGGTLPGAVDKACIMLAVFGSIEVPLQEPLGDRQVLTVF